MNTVQADTTGVGLTQAQLSERFSAEVSNLLAQTSKLNAETSKINAESHWYPVAMAAAIMAGAGGFVGAVITILIKFVF